IQAQSRPRRPATYLVDELEFYQETRPENDEQIYGITATYVPEENRVFVGWGRHKDENTIAHEVRYAFSSIHAIGWEAATPAPHGVVRPPGYQGYFTMYYDTTEIPITDQPTLYIAIKPQNAALFSEIAMPLSLEGPKSVPTVAITSPAEGASF